MMNVIRRQNELVVQIPDNLPFNYLDELVGYLTVKAILARSEATDDNIDALSEQIKADWWDKNRSWFLNEDRH